MSVLPVRLPVFQPRTPKRPGPIFKTYDGEKTRPNTPESPTLYVQANRRRLQREATVIFNRTILQYDFSTDSLCPWYW
jgi:hypothetical protein